ncbi:hypothetical protein NOR_04172 [Metarhizium rileyi]|uniref:Uncharacterized protein n=1 Tax=Metarhizium rileyi (strain RCEF 4871) TaxID=1649241 RepID=A0A167EAR8_METRR|nr:hypothetical protein NOR_04172 [Metarhizium rileyi RCEF 4871]TWU72871.1 hypothetical protein ED733_003729 [Metarhizium rileyi]
MKININTLLLCSAGVTAAMSGLNFPREDEQQPPAVEGGAAGQSCSVDADCADSLLICDVMCIGGFWASESNEDCAHSRIANPGTCRQTKKKEEKKKEQDDAKA